MRPKAAQRERAPGSGVREEAANQEPRISMRQTDSEHYTSIPSNAVRSTWCRAASSTIYSGTYLLCNKIRAVPPVSHFGSGLLDAAMPPIPNWEVREIKNQKSQMSLSHSNRSATIGSTEA